MKLLVNAGKVAFALLLFGGVAGILIWLSQKPATQLSVEAEKIKALCDSIELEMTERELDALLAEYESSTATFERNEDNAGRQLIRTAHFTKFYTKKGAIEGDYCIMVYLDDS